MNRICLCQFHDRKQSAVIVEVFILWLCNPHHFTRDVIRTKIIPRDLPYNKSMRTKTHCENKFQIISTQTVYILLESGP